MVRETPIRTPALAAVPAPYASAALSLLTIVFAVRGEMVVAFSFGVCAGLFAIAALRT
jgi:hypothetical protein